MKIHERLHRCHLLYINLKLEMHINFCQRTQETNLMSHCNFFLSKLFLRPCTQWRFADPTRFTPAEFSLVYIYLGSCISRCSSLHKKLLHLLSCHWGRGSMSRDCLTQHYCSLHMRHLQLCCSTTCSTTCFSPGPRLAPSQLSCCHFNCIMDYFHVQLHGRAQFWSQMG